MPTPDVLRLIDVLSHELPDTAALLLSISGVLLVLPAEETRAFDGKVCSLVKVLVSGLPPAVLEAAGWKVGQ